MTPEPQSNQPDRKPTHQELEAFRNINREKKFLEPGCSPEPQSNDAHECKYSSDGGSCVHCGLTVSDRLVIAQSNDAPGQAGLAYIAQVSTALNDRDQARAVLRQTVDALEALTDVVTAQPARSRLDQVVAAARAELSKP